MGNAHCRTNIHSDWYKPEGINMTKLTNLTVTCAKRQHTLPECTKHTSPCLFNIKEDPCEFNNIAKQHPELVNSMVKRLHQFAVKKWVDQLVFSTRIFVSRAKITLIEFVRWKKTVIGSWDKMPMPKTPFQKMLTPTQNPKHINQWQLIHWRFVCGIQTGDPVIAVG